MDLQDLRWHWDAFGATDPMWAILTDPERRGNKWTPEEFFASGRGEIKAFMERVNWLQLTFGRERALDFGCGLGRLTQALGEYFQECHGVDIAGSMVEGARRYNRLGERCHYHVNTKADLSLFPDNHFDLVYTVVVLQHMQPRYEREYVREFIRVIKPGGLAAFQIPAGPAKAEAPDPPRFTKPMPRAAFRAVVTPLVSDLQLLADASVIVPVRVTNASPVIWLAEGAEDQRFRVQLGNHWSDSSGQQITLDDGRAPLPRDIAPGDSVDLHLTVRAPQAPGQYRLDLDMVQETVDWFARRGSVRASIPVVVINASLQPVPPSKPSAQEPVAPAPEREPFMEMYTLPVRDVFEIIDQQGGKLLHVFDDTAGGGLETIYYATK